MSLVISFLLVAVCGLLVSFPMEACIERFCKEEKILVKDFKQDMKYHPILALIVSVLFLLLFFVYGISEQFFVYCFLVIVLIIDLFTDLKMQIIPNGLNMVGFLVGSIYMYVKLVFNTIQGADMFLGMLVGGGIFALIALFALLVYRKEGMGLGDVKLMGVLGIFLGVRNIFQVFVVSFAIGAVVSIILLIAKVRKMDDYIPFGPFIVAATIFTMFFPYSSVLAWIF